MAKLQEMVVKDFQLTFRHGNSIRFFFIMFFTMCKLLVVDKKTEQSLFFHIGRSHQQWWFENGGPGMPLCLLERAGRFNLRKVDRWMDRWLDGRTVELMDTWMDTWMDTLMVA